MKNPELKFPMLKYILGTGTLRELAARLGVTGSYISQQMSHDERKPPSAEFTHNLLQLLNNSFSGCNFGEADLLLDEADFLARFPRDKINYERAASAGKIKTDLHVNPNLRLLFGNFMRFYLCADPAKTDDMMLGVDQYVISPGRNPDEATVTQTTNEFSGGRPAGFARLYGTTLRIELAFPSNEFPPALFLASYPQAAAIDAFIAGCLDVRDDGLAVVARPMFFIRVKNLAPEIGLTFGSETRIFKASKALLGQFVRFNADKGEMVPRPGILTEDLIEWRLAYDEIRQEAAASVLPNA
jgi:transcriptional regulator with XRE-family HTH domain